MAAKRIVIDPVTRIEGHLRVEVEVKDGIVTDAFSSGTMVRGLEIILRGRDPRDAWAFAERTCGVCTTVHALASVRSVEDALGIVIPPNAELIRNLMFCTQYMQDHVVHFYHLHALDWVDVVSALKADPKATSELGAKHFQLAEKFRRLFLRRAEAHHQIRRERPARHFRQRLLGPSGDETAAGSQSARRGALHRSARMAEGNRQGPHDFRRQESASELSRRRRAVLAEPRRGQRHQRRAPRLRRQADDRRENISWSRFIFPTCWPSRRFTKTGARLAAA